MISIKGEAVTYPIMRLLANLLALLTLATLGASLPLPVAAQSYPSKPVRLILPFPPGGATDLLGRAIAQKLSDNMGQQFVAENRPGAGGNIGAEAVAKSPPDGYTLLLGAPSLAISPSLYTKLNYDPLRDLAPIALVASIPNVVIVNAEVPARTLKELIELARAQPGKLNYGSGGAGTSNHLAGELFKSMTSTQIVHVPYKGVETAMLGMLSGQVQIVIMGLPPALPHINSGKLRALAAVSKERLARLPDVPTVAEAGLPDFQVDTWYGILAPAGTPPEIITRLNRELVKAMQSSDMKERLDAMVVQPLTSTPEGFADMLKAETAKWAKVVKDSGAKVD
jgi:tripartite-type tricarboxylate transporter receptor subunit TctC